MAAPAPQQDGRRLARVLASGARRHSSFSRRRLVSGIGSATNCSARTLVPRAARAAARRLGRRRSWLRHRAPDAELAPHVGARRRRGCIGRDARCGSRSRSRVSTNVELRQGALEALPIEDGNARCGRDDARAASSAVAWRRPGRGEARARPGGRLLVVDMAAHEREEYRQQMGHVWLGFAEEQMRRLIEQAGFDPCPRSRVGARTTARGPSLFAAAPRHRRAQTLKPAASQLTPKPTPDKFLEQEFHVHCCNHRTRV